MNRAVIEASERAPENAIEMKPKAYVETSLVSYLTARSSENLVRAAHQQVTREWWAGRGVFDLYIS